MLTAFYRSVSVALVPCIVLAGVPLASQAAIVPTEAAISTAVADGSRERVQAFFEREDVRAALQEQGVSAHDALARVNAMSDAEVAQLAHRVDQAPAGSGVVGVLFSMFLILLVTDILGFTKVFPFTRSVR